MLAEKLSQLFIAGECWTAGEVWQSRSIACIHTLCTQEYSHISPVETEQDSQTALLVTRVKSRKDTTEVFIAARTILVLQAGDLVWRNKDPSLDAQARASYESLSSAEMRKVPVDVIVSGSLGQVWRLPSSILPSLSHVSHTALLCIP